ncbi:protein TOO MANY MOUTHS-like [Macadamia integrifolia]|uniref:protein TOO MANY MOUTHS-like n=1 Tax=Macadamia integrifolia TaxID=60698 RepID=UPI001C52EC96|nr:protein TOO MANY MOUTHS-like [Macadamia integrifolia]
MQALILKGNPTVSSSIRCNGFDRLKDLMILILSDSESFGRLQNLYVVHLDKNHLNGSIPPNFEVLNNLSEMRLNDSQLTSLISFGSSNSMQALILKGNPTVSSSIRCNGFDRLKDLMILILSKMGFQGPISESFGRLQNLYVVHLDKNHLNGSIPSNFEVLNNLSEMRLNDSQLTGSLPFKRETIWRMGRKLRLCNKLDLCYDAYTGLQDGSASSFLSGISPCKKSKSTSPRARH